MHCLSSDTKKSRGFREETSASVGKALAEAGRWISESASSVILYNLPALLAGCIRRLRSDRSHDESYDIENNIQRYKRAEECRPEHLQLMSHRQVKNSKRKSDADIENQADRDAANQALSQRVGLDAEQSCELCRNQRDRKDYIDQKSKTERDHDIGKRMQIKQNGLYFVIDKT